MNYQNIENFKLQGTDRNHHHVFAFLQENCSEQIVVSFLLYGHWGEKISSLPEHSISRADPFIVLKSLIRSSQNLSCLMVNPFHLSLSLADRTLVHFLWLKLFLDGSRYLSLLFQKQTSPHYVHSIIFRLNEWLFIILIHYWSSLLLQLLFYKRW